MMDPLMKKIIQVACITHKCDNTVLKIIQDFGIGPWMVYEFTPQNNSNLKLWEEPKETISMRLAVTNIGRVEFEYIEPTSPESIYAEHLSNHGEGLHHVAFDVEDYQDAIKHVQRRGLRNAMSGIWLGGKDWSYLETEQDLKFVGEIYEISPEFGYPTPDAFLPPQYDVLSTYYPVMIDVTKVGMVVDDIYETIRTYGEDYGHSNWAVTRYDKSNVENMMLDGKPASYSYLSALMEVDGFQFELIQPLEGDSIFHKRLAQYGEGMYHLGFRFSKDYDTTLNALQEKGYHVVQSEQRGEKRVGFIDASDTFKAVIEVSE